MTVDRRTTHSLVTVVAVAMLGSCGNETAPTPADSTTPTTPTARAGLVAGTVAADPSCPVESAREPCTVTPIVGAAVELYVAGTVVAAGQTDERGRFRLRAPPGRVVVLVHAPSEIGSDTRRTVLVRSGHATKLSLGLDTGIR